MKIKFLSILLIILLFLSSLPADAQEGSSLPSLADNSHDNTRPRYNVIDLGGFGGNKSYAFGINDADQIVGAALLSDNTTYRGFLWQNGVLKALPDLGGGATEAIDINEDGIIAGVCQLDDKTIHHACRWQNNQLTDLDSLGGNYSEALGINNAGQVVGYSLLDDNQTNSAFLWQYGSMVKLNTLGGKNSVADYINQAGQIVGYSYLSDNKKFHAVLWQSGIPTDLGTLGGNYSRAAEINNTKQIVGYSYLNGDTTYHAFLWQNNQMTDLMTLGGPTSFAQSINDHGQIVGISSTGTAAHAFLWENGKMLDLNDMIPQNSGWVLNLAYHINNHGKIVGYGTYQGQTRAFLLTYRPVLIVPGIAGSFSVDNEFVADSFWLIWRGMPPNGLRIDPLARVYDDLIKTLEAVGYTLDKDLFVVNYDWRLAPAPVDNTIDGYIAGLSAYDISSTRYLYGVDYLGYSLRKAAEVWAADYPNQPLEEVDVIAHSTGGLLTRAYIQSDAYGDYYYYPNRLPKIANFIMIGVPNRGASKAWNPLHNNWYIEPAYSMVLSKILNRAYQKVLSGSTINGPDYNIRLNDILDDNGKPDPLFFIQRYVPTIRSLLATYDFIDYGNGYISLEDDPTWRNDLLLDLNNGLDAIQVGNPNTFTDQAKVTVIYGTNETTPIYVEERNDFEYGALLAFDQFVRRPAVGVTWFKDIFQEYGDGTVPLISSMEQFLYDSRVTLKPFTKSLILGGIDHTALVSNPDVQKTILDILGHPFKNEDIHTGTWKGWWNILCALIDPVEGVLMDGSGRRLGYTAATGPLTEIPGSLWFGGADGMGWILEPVQQPLSLQLTGLGENYYAMVAADQVTLQGGLVISGTLGLGETLNFPISLLPKNPLYLPLVIK